MKNKILKKHIDENVAKLDDGKYNDHNILK